MATCISCKKTGLFLKVSENGLCQECEDSLSYKYSKVISETSKLEKILNKIDEGSLSVEETLYQYDEAILAAIELFDTNFSDVVPETVKKIIDSKREFIRKTTPKYHGDIGLHNLGEWFDVTFTEEEREMMAEKYQPFGVPPRSLVEGRGISGYDTTTFLGFLIGWFNSPVENSIWQRIREKLNQHLFAKFLDPNEIHYDPSLYMEEIEHLIRHNNLDQAEALVLKCIKRIEEKRFEKEKIPPAFYNKLSIIQRKQGRLDEAESSRIKADQIVIDNFVAHVKMVYKMPTEEMRNEYYPDGPVITKKVTTSAKRLEKHTPNFMDFLDIPENEKNRLRETMQDKKKGFNLCP